jgi:hypothetical protein
MKPSARRAGAATLALALAAWLGACAETSTTAPDSPPVRAAKGGKGGGPGGGGGGNPTVDRTNPSKVVQDVTIDLDVFGTNYEANSVVDFLLGGAATTHIRTNRTNFKSSTQLTANITVSATAALDLYDVRVTTPGGKKGVGIELLEVGLAAVLTDQDPGVKGDGIGPYVGSNATDRFKLLPQCGDRSMSLENVDVSVIGYSLANQSTCNGVVPQDPGWVFLHLSDLLITGDCGSAAGPSAPACPFDLLPRFRVHGKKLIAQGAFAFTAQYFQRDRVSGQTYFFLFQDASVVTGASGAKTFTATRAHVYIDNSFVCEGDSDGDPTTIADCTDVTLPVAITVTP